MYVVAVVELAAPAEVEMAPLAKDLGNTPYEARLMLVGGSPAMVARVPTAEAAQALAGKIAARGHEVVACNLDEVVSSDAMITVRKFRFEADRLALENGESLPYESVRAFFKAMHRSSSETSTTETKQKFDAGRALLSGGVLMTKKTTSTTHSVANERQQVLYIFRNAGETPWILREAGAHYAGLGDKMSASRFENFGRTVQELRARTPGAIYDERLMTVRRVPETVSSQGTATSRSSAVSQEAGMDMLAHVLFAALKRRGPAAR